MHYIALIILCIPGLFLVALAITDRGPVKHAPCDCPGCQIQYRKRNDMPLTERIERRQATAWEIAHHREEHEHFCAMEEARRKYGE